MRRFVLAAALSFVGHASCVATSNDDIPCVDYDDQLCPTGYWCGRLDVCESFEDNPPPEIEIVGFATNLGGADEASAAADNAFADEVTVDAEIETIYLRLRNVGGGEAPYPNVSIDAPCCLGSDGSIGSNLIGIIPSGGTETLDFAFRGWSSECPSPSAVTVTVSVLGRVSIATLDVALVEPEDRNIAQRTCSE